MNNNTISAMAMVEFLSSLNGATFCTIITNTDVKMNKRNNPLYGRVTKQAIRNCQFGYNYENAVNNRLDKEGKERSFEAEKLPWGEWVIPNKIIAHNGELYARFYVAKDCVVRNTFYVDGHVATSEEIDIINAFMVKPKSSNTQSECGLEENQVKPYTINIKNILTIRANGIELSAKDYAEQKA